MRYGADSQCGPGAELCFVTVLVVLGRDQKFTFKQLYVRWEPFSLTLTITRLFDPSGALEVRFSPAQKSCIAIKSWNLA